ncbi:MAG: thioredoxin-dependent thiol peroxidase [Chlorobiaceae bacterium]|nr:thioredoxin-dependent thiol peroxidase [Chlorobiaceae bacterium]MBA4308951.1 thioredoxin-dependent thiol peroxidase [Chlorobiaceae bacterium]
MLEIGMKVSDIKLFDQNGISKSLQDFEGKKIVLFFYPKDNTPGCTKEACSFRDEIKVIEEENAVVIGVSADSIKSHKNFSEKFNLPFTLLSDEKKEFLQAFGVWKEKSMYGKKYMGIERTTFIIDENGIIKHIFSKVKVDNHSEEVIKLLRELS